MLLTLSVACSDLAEGIGLHAAGHQRLNALVHL
jgi:hypothetical protein